MIYRYSYHRFFVTILIVAIFVEAGFLLMVQPIQMNSENGVPSQREGVWSTQIRVMGPKLAYKSFIATYSQDSLNEQHTRAHEFGADLYHTVGLEGIEVCDRSFQFGCFHEFLGLAIAEKGLPVVSELNDVCLRKHSGDVTGCQHGVGHGVAGYYGYDDEALTEALAVCDRLDSSTRVGGCYGGVFMEYNLRTLLSVDGEPPRTFYEEKGPHDPCVTLDTAHQAPCFFWQPQWWQSVFFDEWSTQVSRNAMAVRMGVWCGDIVDKDNKSLCFRGIGTNIPAVTDWDEIETKYLCDSMPTQRATIECRAGAASVFFGQISVGQTPWGMCNDLSEKDRITCISIAQNPR